MMRRVLIWGDIAFYLAILIAAVVLRPRTRVQVAAIAVAAVAFPLWIAARVQLGSAISLWPEARTLVTNGFYSRIRHPVYLFGTIASLAALLALQIWPVFAIGVALVPVTLVRAWREQKVLEDAFGERYRQYRERTWF
jgi:protein-S-isoprenylcysteine O-methyltransferase Ste14